jgi:hypothetical protein
MLSLGVGVLLCIALWVFWPRSEEGRSAQAGATTSATGELAPAPAIPAAESVRASSSAAGASATGRPSAARQPSSEQQQLRERILQSLRQHDPSGSSAPAAVTAPGPSGPEPAHVPREGTMKDKTGLMGDEVKVVNRELMPMVAGCVDEAHERNPRLHGMLALSVKLASAEGVGSVFETVEPSAANEVPDPELIDCIRQSAFTLSLPMPKANSLHGGVLTIPIDAAADAG